MDGPRDQPDVLTRTIDLGWRAFTSAWLLLVVATLAMIGSVIPSGIVGVVADGTRSLLAATGSDAAVLWAVWIVGQVLSLGLTAIIMWPTQAGAGIAAVRASRGHPQDFGAVIAGFRRFVPTVGAMSLYFILSLVANAPGFVATWFGLGDTVRASVEAGQLVISGLDIAWLAFGIIWTSVAGLWLGARLSIAPLRAADPDLPRVGAFAAISETWAATRGHTLAGIAMLILSGIAVFVGFACCGIGAVLLGMPLWLGLQAGFYRAVFAHAEPPPPAPAPAWTGATPPTQPYF